MLKNYPLDVLVIGMHHHGPQDDTIEARRALRESPKVRSYGSTQNTEEAERLLRNGDANVVFYSPWVRFGSRKGKFIEQMRKKHPRVVFVLYAESDQRERLVSEWKRFEHYFWLEPSSLQRGPSSGLDEVLERCQETLYESFDYDLAISFAGEQREIARELAVGLQDRGNRVFFDEFERGRIFGKDLYGYLHQVYSQNARYCLMLISKDYEGRAWTNHERRSLQSRQLEEVNGDYILPVRVDDTDLPGVLSTTGYIDLRDGADVIIETAHSKLWNENKASVKRIMGSSAPEYEDL